MSNVFNAFALIDKEHKCVMAVSTVFNKLVDYLEDYLVCETSYSNKEINEFMDHIHDGFVSETTYSIVPINRDFRVTKGQAIELPTEFDSFNDYEPCVRVVL